MECWAGELVWQASEHHAHSLLDMTWADFSIEIQIEKGIYLEKSINYILEWGQVKEFMNFSERTLILINREFFESHSDFFMETEKYWKFKK